MRRLVFLFLLFLLPQSLLADETAPEFDTKSVLEGVNAEGILLLLYAGYTRGVAEALVVSTIYDDDESKKRLFCMPSDKVLSGDLLVSLVSSNLNSITDNDLRDIHYTNSFPISAIEALKAFFPCN